MGKLGSKFEGRFSMKQGSSSVSFHEELRHPAVTKPSSSFTGMGRALASEEKNSKYKLSSHAVCSDTEVLPGGGMEVGGLGSFQNQDSDIVVVDKGKDRDSRIDEREDMERCVSSDGTKRKKGEEEEEEEPRKELESWAESSSVGVSNMGMVSEIRPSKSDHVSEFVCGDEKLSDPQQQQQREQEPSMEVQEEGTTTTIEPAAQPVVPFVDSQKQTPSHHPPPPSATKHAQSVVSDVTSRPNHHDTEYTSDCSTGAAVTDTSMAVTPDRHVMVDHAKDQMSEHATSLGHVTEPVVSQHHVQAQVATTPVTQSSSDHLTSNAANYLVSRQSATQEPWFSIFSRKPCENPTNQIQSSLHAASLGAQQAIMAVSSEATQLPDQQQQQVIVAAGATSAPQYVYVTADGQVLGAAPPQVAQQVVNTGGTGSEAQGIAYALVGNSLVPVMTGGGGGGGGTGGLVAVNPGSAAQQSVQYVVAQADQQGGVQYLALPGGSIGGGSGLGVWPTQPQYAVVADGSGQQQIVQVMSRENGGQVLVLPSNQPQGQSGGQLVMAAAAAAQPQANQLVIGQGQSGQLVVAAQQQGGQVVLGQAGQAGQLVVAAAGTAQGQTNQQVSLGQGLVIAGQSPQHPQSNQVLLTQGQSGQVMVAAGPVAEQQSLLVGHGQSFQAGGDVSVQSQDPLGHDIIRGGQVVQIPEQNKFGILSSDGTKLVISESKEAAFATLQAANSSIAGFTQQQQQSASPVVISSHSSSPARSAMTTPTQQSVSYGGHNVKKELISPDPDAQRNFMIPPSSASAPSTSPRPLSGKATPTTVGQATANVETTDSSRQQDDQKVRM